jgi:hypothetical protein
MDFDWLQQSRMIHTENPAENPMGNLGQVQSSHVRAASQAPMKPCWKMDELLWYLQYLLLQRDLFVFRTVPISPKISKCQRMLNQP